MSDTRRFLAAVLASVVLLSSGVRISAASRPSAAEDSKGAHCCFPDQFTGRLSLSSTLDPCGGPHEGEGRDDSLLGFSFAVDYALMRLYGEHVGRHGGSEGRLHHIEFAADLRAGALIVRERRSNRCWTFPTGERTADRCVLDDALYRGDIALPRRKGCADPPSHRTGALYVLRRSLDEDDDPPEGAENDPFRSLLLVAGDTCLPVLEMDSADTDRYTGFRDMQRGLGDFGGRRGEGMLEPCLEQSRADDVESFVSSEEDGGGRGKRAAGRGSGRSLIRMDIYIYLLKLFFPRAPPQPCCGPQQWQGSLLKTITYTNVKSSYTGEAMTSLPHIYVDHVLGKMAGSVIEYAGDVQTSNHSFLAIYGTELTIYDVQWTNNNPTCSVLIVTDVSGAMKTAACMLPTARYQGTVRLGGSGPLDSIRLQVWDNAMTSIANTSLNFTSQSYISPRVCMSVLETYSWESSTERVWGTLVQSNAQAFIANPSAVFAVPASCAGVAAFKVTSAQVEKALEYALSHAA